MSTEPERTASLKAHLVVTSAAVAAFSPLYCLQALYPAISTRFSGDVGLAASLLTTTTLALAVVSLLSGRPAAAHGPRAAVLWALLSTVVSTVGLGLADSTSILICWRLVQGVTIAVGLSSLISSLGMLAPTGAASLASSYSTGIILGGILGRLVPAALMEWGWTPAFMAFASIQGLLMAVVWWALPRSDVSEDRVVKLEPIQQWLKSLLPVFRNDIPHLAVGGAVLMISQAAATSMVSIHLSQEPFNWSTAQLGLLYLVFAPALVVVRFVPGLIERIGPLWLQVLATNLLLAGLLTTLGGGSGQIVAGMAIFCAAVFTSQTVFAYLLNTVDPSVRQKASSCYLASYYLGASIGAAAPATVWNEYGWPGTVALVVLVQLAGAVLAFGFIRRRQSVLAESHRDGGISAMPNAGDTRQP